MKRRGGNLFSLASWPTKNELFDSLAKGEGVLVERIVSSGQCTPPGEWLVGEEDEWVALLSGEARLFYEDNTLQELRPGDWVFIPAGLRHRVEYTTSQPPCIWLAVHARMG